MKAKLEKYLGPNKVVAGGKVIRLAVNHPHPEPGSEIEFGENQILAEKPEAKPAEVVKNDKK